MAFRHVTEEHVFDVLLLHHRDIRVGSGGGIALGDFQRQDRVLVDIEGKVVLQIGRRILCDDALQINALPGSAGGVVGRLPICRIGAASQACQQQDGKQHAEHFLHGFISFLHNLRRPRICAQAWCSGKESPRKIRCPVHRSFRRRSSSGACGPGQTRQSSFFVYEQLRFFSAAHRTLSF